MYLIFMLFDVWIFTSVFASSAMDILAIWYIPMLFLISPDETVFTLTWRLHDFYHFAFGVGIFRQESCALTCGTLHSERILLTGDVTDHGVYRMRPDMSSTMSVLWTMDV